MFNAPYRAAVIGRTGRGDYGHGLDAAVRDHPDLELVAVADDDPAGLAAAARRLGVEKAYGDYRAMLDREKPEFVAVAPRWMNAHREMIVACAERGIHVYCEKPLAPTPADCDAIVAACERAHVKLAIAFPTRHSRRFGRVRGLIDEGTIGEVLEVRARGKEDRRGGGEDLMVLGAHLMDLMRGLLGEAAGCFARVTDGGRPIDRRAVKTGAEGMGLMAGDRVDAVYGFAKRPTLAYFASARPKSEEPPGGRFGVQVLGSKGRIDLGTGFEPPAFLLRDPTWQGRKADAGWEEIKADGEGDPADGNRAALSDLIGAVLEDRQPVASVYDGRAAIEMILACYASQAKGGPVKLPLLDRTGHPLERV